MSAVERHGMEMVMALEFSECDIIHVNPNCINDLCGCIDQKRPHRSTSTVSRCMEPSKH